MSVCEGVQIDSIAMLYSHEKAQQKLFVSGQATMKSIKGKVLFVNPASRIAAAYIGGGQCIVFEYQSSDHFKVGEVLDRLRSSYGHNICDRVTLGCRATVNVLSSAMDRRKAELVVSPWRDTVQEEYSMAEYAYA